MKTVLITGACRRRDPQLDAAACIGGNCGLGFETAAVLADRGHDIIIACRDPTKGEQAAQSIRARVSDAKVESRVLDLANFESIRAFAKQMVEDSRKLDVLINNAGVFCCPQSKTTDGLEMQIGTNHMGHFLLTSLLYPLLKQHDEEARIVVLGSASHKVSKGISFEDINNEKSYSPFKMYAQSKLANILFAYEAARRIPKGDKVTVNVCDPGIVRTNIGRHVIGEKPNVLVRALRTVMEAFLKTPAQGAATIVHVADAATVEGVTGKYFRKCKEAASSKRSCSEDDAKRLWDLSNAMTGAQWEF